MSLNVDINFSKLFSDLPPSSFSSQQLLNMPSKKQKQILNCLSSWVFQSYTFFPDARNCWKSDFLPHSNVWSTLGGWPEWIVTIICIILFHQIPRSMFFSPQELMHREVCPVCKDFLFCCFIENCIIIQKCLEYGLSTVLSFCNIRLSTSHTFSVHCCS